MTVIRTGGEVAPRACRGALHGMRTRKQGKAFMGRGVLFVFLSFFFVACGLGREHKWTDKLPTSVIQNSIFHAHSRCAFVRLVPSRAVVLRRVPFDSQIGTPFLAGRKASEINTCTEYSVLHSGYSAKYVNPVNDCWPIFVALWRETASGCWGYRPTCVDALLYGVHPSGTVLGLGTSVLL